MILCELFLELYVCVVIGFVCNCVMSVDRLFVGLVEMLWQCVG